MIHPAVLPQQTWAENWVCAPLGELSFHLTQYRMGRDLSPYKLSTKWHLDPSSRLGLYEVWTGPMGEGALGPHLTQRVQGRGLPTYQVAP